jgi:hypothetical protein
LKSHFIERVDPDLCGFYEIDGHMSGLSNDRHTGVDLVPLTSQMQKHCLSLLHILWLP